MCMICVEFQRQRLSIAEARRNLREMIETLDPKHVAEVERLLAAAESAQAANPANAGNKAP